MLKFAAPKAKGEVMKWCVEVRGEVEEINAAIGEAATLGRELVTALPGNRIERA
jgi:microcompartment protein CcmL/EutN